MGESFELQLNAGELFWLAKALQINSLRLPHDPLTKIAPHETKEVLTRAQESLKLRGYIQSTGGQNWQVDRLPAAIIRWLDTAESRVEAQVIRRNGVTQKANLFSQADMYMITTEEGTSIHFKLIPDRSGLVDTLLAWIGKPALPDARQKSGLPSYKVPQPENVIPAAWHDKNIAEVILKRFGSDVKEIASILKWIDTLQWVAMLSPRKFQMDAPAAEEKCAVCANGQTVWFGSGIANSLDKIPMLPTLEKELITKLKKIM